MHETQFTVVVIALMLFGAFALWRISRGAPTRLKNTTAEVKVLRIQPGDVLIARVPGPITTVVAEHLRDQVAREFPGHKCLVLSEGLELDVAREKAPEVAGG